MSRPDVDEVLNYLSIKFNKIFCDRDFVCCVIEDFQKVLDIKNKNCVLVFPTLGPIYLKALRYQARIFDLAVFNITSPSGKFKSIAVCHKDHLKKPNPVTMPETVSKRKRPERQLYVPPAQRASRLSGKQCDKKVTPEANKQDCQKSVQCFSEAECVLRLSDIVNFLYFFHSHCEFQCPKSYDYHNCEFEKFLKFRKFSTLLKYDYSIKIFDNCLVLSYVRWNLNDFNFNYSGRYQSYPSFDFANLQAPAEKHSAILVDNELIDFQIELHETDLYKVECDTNCDEIEKYQIVDLSVLELGHFFIISIEGSDYLHQCQEKHDVKLCYENTRNQLEVSKQVEKVKMSAIKSENDAQPNDSIKKTIDTIETNEINKNLDKNETPKTNKDIVKNQKNKKKISDNKHEQEKEIMRMTKEYINRKTRPIMKYVDDTNDTLQIDKNDSVNNWEDLFDDNGEIQEELLTEIVDKVGDDITIVKANEDYTAYTNKPPEDLEHIVELYNFPATLETHDLVQAFSDINSDAMYIKWVDDTHALLVLGSLSQAQKAVNMRNPLIKVRPMTAASAISMDVANKSDLKPAMKRPPTNLQTARRLITSHLGTKSKITKEQMAKEKQDLKDAREMKRLLKQSERDAWEGKLKSSVN